MKTYLKYLFISLLLFVNSLIAQTTFFKLYGTESKDDCWSFIKTKDGGYALTGSTNQNEVFILKTDGQGDSLWMKTYDQAWIGRSIKQTEDSGYVIACGASAVIMKTNKMGELQWSKKFPFYESRCVQITKDESYIVTGGLDTIFLAKIDEYGNTKWLKSYPITNTFQNIAYSVKETEDEGFILSGTVNFSENPLKRSEIILIKTNNNGDTLWTRTYGHEYADESFTIDVTREGNFFLTGYYSELNGSLSRYIWLLLLDSNGDTIWTKKIPFESEARSGKQTKDGGYVVIGSTYNEDYRPFIYLIKLNKDGDIEWSKILGKENFYSARGTDITESDDGGYIICGYGETDQYHFDSEDIFIAKADGNGNITSINSRKNNNNAVFELLQNYPNPFNPSTTIEFHIPEAGQISLKLYDLLGKEVAEIYNGYKSMGVHKIYFDTSEYSLASGIYYYTLRENNYHKSKKLLFLK